MSEKSPKPKTKEALTEQEQYYLEQEKLFLEDYPTIEVEQLSPEQCAETVRELETLYTNFEQTHDLAVLNAIQLSTPEEAYANQVREAAKKDLPAIVSLKNFLNKQSNIPEDVVQQLHRRYQLIQAAVGAINNGRLDHSIR